jgi:hypothetical protein
LATVSKPGIIDRTAIAALANAITKASNNMLEPGPINGTIKVTPASHPTIIHRNARRYERLIECSDGQCARIVWLLIVGFA